MTTRTRWMLALLLALLGACRAAAPDEDAQRVDDSNARTDSPRDAGYQGPLDSPPPVGAHMEQTSGIPIGPTSLAVGADSFRLGRGKEGAGEGAAPQVAERLVAGASLTTGDSDFFLGVGERCRTGGGGPSGPSGPTTGAAPVQGAAQDEWFGGIGGDASSTGEFVETAEYRFATFAADVDTASFARAMRALREGEAPNPGNVRVEEFVNAFEPDVEPPLADTFALELELAPHPFAGPGESLWTLRAALRGREVLEHERKPFALTLVVDTSGSMEAEDRLGLVKRGLRMLLPELDANDALAIVAFARDARVAVPMTSAVNLAALEGALDALEADGSTSVERGLALGYEVASAAFHERATNRVVLFSDGLANVGITDAQSILASIVEHRRRGIYLNTIGVGGDACGDELLEELADRGNGICSYLGSAEEARSVFVEDLIAIFEPIARDVKLQVEFDPEQVVRWRLLGYENRRLSEAEFDDPGADAGEVGAGHQVCALFEIERMPTGPDPVLPLASLRVRWTAPSSDDAFELAQELRARDARGSFAGSSLGFRRTALVARYAEVLSGRSEALSGEGLALETERLLPELSKSDAEALSLLQRAFADPRHAVRARLVAAPRSGSF